MDKIIRLKVIKTDEHEAEETKPTKSNIEDFRIYKVKEITGSLYFVYDNNRPKFIWPGMRIRWSNISALRTRDTSSIEKIELEIVDNKNILISKISLDVIKDLGIKDQE